MTFVVANIFEIGCSMNRWEFGIKREILSTKNLCKETVRRQTLILVEKNFCSLSEFAISFVVIAFFGTEKNFKFKWIFLMQIFLQF